MVSNMKKQPLDFEPLTLATQKVLKQPHTETSLPYVYSGQTALKLIYKAEGLKYGWCQHNDVMHLPPYVWPNRAGVYIGVL